MPLSFGRPPPEPTGRVVSTTADLQSEVDFIADAAYYSWLLTCGGAAIVASTEAWEIAVSRKLALALCATLMACVFAAHAKASIVYDLDRTIGAGGIIGSIETDGTVGVLGDANIVDWNLVIDDGSGTFNLLGPQSGSNSESLIFGSALSATATDLLFDFGAAGLNLFIIQNPTVGSGQNFWCLDAQFNCTTLGPSIESTRVGSSGGVTQPYSGIEVIGSVFELPEPDTLALLGLGLAGLGFAARRRRGQQTRRDTL